MTCVQQLSELSELKRVFRECAMLFVVVSSAHAQQSHARLSRAGPQPDVVGVPVRASTPPTASTSQPGAYHFLLSPLLSSPLLCALWFSVSHYCYCTALSDRLRAYRLRARLTHVLLVLYRESGRRPAESVQPAVRRGLPVGAGRRRAGRAALSDGPHFHATSAPRATGTSMRSSPLLS